MRDCLSTGEKNLVSLLLFLKNPNGSVLLIDDPASSFDDYRRTQIFDMIQGAKDKTILVVSHDQAFVKRAILKKATCENIGKVQAMAKTSHGFVFTDIEREDVVYLPDQVRKRISQVSSYWTKAVNLRLLCDLKKRTLPGVWGYSSAILHKNSAAEIHSILNDEGLSEKNVLASISKEFGVDMPKIPVDFPNNLDDSEMTNFERLIALRELLNDKNSNECITLNKGRSGDCKVEIEMLNDLVHMNDASAYCLNPYKYQLWSPALMEFLEQNKQ